MRKVPFALCLAGLTLGGAGLAGCSQKTATETAEPVTKAEAQSVLADFAQAAQSMDLPMIDKWYDDDVIAYDAFGPDVIDGKVSMHVANARFVDMKFDHVEMPDPKIQILGPDLFIASGKVHLTSSAGKEKEADMRYTEVFRKKADGSWVTVHEHIDVPPAT
ncbi:YybH family protein [Novosphingobium mangrovi (ex Huang et al. 2023)]|uniref:DUF4440 domain-containing protein n=1 Tax=Novosphingobium mangrovi (ex Huang et al. 2023) TaxID=2976432 RepID=A0ABT2I7J4_9SPHN|nr:DUF4440 domain-containing protein [Novosphingobium mangrovi (ex Huang et al. 2023)]MCT2400776.1 DUF4440 domain-containing protein [Novosphingobium mangrovi (ex Huang et al. 2023)]